MLAGLQTRILRALSHEVPVDDGASGPVAEPLAVLEWSYPNLRNLIGGKTVLDLGCSFGDQAAALTRKYGCKVTGVDTDKGYLAEAIRRYGEECEFLSAIPSGRQWDVVLSINSMEHYPDPRRALDDMLAATRAGGKILITFGPLWWAPWGSHMQFFCRIPWLQLWFCELAIMTVRSKYRPDGAMRFEDCQGGLNRMSVRKFESLINGHDADVRYIAVKHLQLLTHLPVLRELFTNHAIAELTLSDDSATSRIAIEA